jgi:DNA processing protein
METEVHVHSRDVASARTLQWLALSLTPGIGAGRGRKLVELFNGIDRLFNAPLTELEGAGLPAGAAQSIAMGKSLELAADEFDRTKAFVPAWLRKTIPSFPNACMRFTIRLSCCTSAGTLKLLVSMALR